MEDCIMKMTKIQAYYELESIKRAIILAKGLYYSKMYISAKDLRLFFNLYSNARNIKTYISETGDLELLVKVTALERGWLNHLLNDYDLPEDIAFSIKKATRILLDMDEARKEMDNPPTGVLAASNKNNDMISQTTKNENNMRSIKEDELKSYFKLSFKGGGNGNIDYFTNNLLPDLRQNRTDKDFARIAYMIYDNEKLQGSMRPNTFKEWYRIFCKLVGCGFHEYKPNALSADDSFKKAFYYLQ